MNNNPLHSTLHTLHSTFHSPLSTICAISTPQGVGGIAVARVSGPLALSIADSLFEGKQSIKEAKANSIHFGRIPDLDEVLVSVFRIIRKDIYYPYFSV